MQNKNFFRRIANMVFTIHKEYIAPFTYKYGSLGKNAMIQTPSHIDGASNIFLGDNVVIKGHNTILTVGDGKFIMKDFSGAAVGLTVIASNHKRPVGVRARTNTDNSYRDIIVEEEVSIGAHVTILAGAHIGRGCIIGANSVIRGYDIPPYSIIIGNPAKVIGFRYTPEECIEHEKIAYSEENRISFDLLKKNYELYYISKKEEIKCFKSISL